MLAIWVKVRIKPAERGRFLAAIEQDALGSERDEAGCCRFNVLQDDADPNTYYFYEVYKDEAAFQAHLQAPHLIKFRETTQAWRAEGPQGAGRGSSNVWPPDDEWK